MSLVKQSKTLSTEYLSFSPLHLTRLLACWLAAGLHIRRALCCKAQGHPSTRRGGSSLILVAPRQITQGLEVRRETRDSSSMENAMSRRPARCVFSLASYDGKSADSAARAGTHPRRLRQKDTLRILRGVTKTCVLEWRSEIRPDPLYTRAGISPSHRFTGAHNNKALGLTQPKRLA
jgi:hypothetical protein